MNKYLQKLNKRPNINFTLLGENIRLKIGDLEVKEGDRLTVLNKKDKVIYDGTVKFILYKDLVDWGCDDAHLDYWHLGFVLDCVYPNQRPTLIDIFWKAKINNWKILKHNA